MVPPPFSPNPPAPHAVVMRKYSKYSGQFSHSWHGGSLTQSWLSLQVFKELSKVACRAELIGGIFLFNVDGNECVT
eukprot:SAG31_NODE_760_length_12279_cov_2.439655_9_plen_76_part_00